MDAQPTSLITRMFDDVETLDDPRADNARHSLTDILVIALLAVMCGLDDYPGGIVEYGRDEEAWLRTFLRLPHGIPSVSTFRRVFAALKPAALLGVMQRWGGVLAGKQIAIDGKTLRRSFEHAWGADRGGLHLVTAWCVEENLVLAQRARQRRAVRPAGPQPLVDRERPALEPGHGVQRGPEPRPQGPRRPEPGGITPDCPGAAPPRHQREAGDQEQAAQGPPQPRLPAPRAPIAGGGQMILPFGQTAQTATNNYGIARYNPAPCRKRLRRFTNACC